MTLRMWALGFAALIAASTGATACEWHNHDKTSMLSAPATEKAPAQKETAVATAAPVDLRLLPYLS